MNAKRIKELIMNGVVDAGGRPEDLELLRPGPLRELGVRLAEFGKEFPSWVVKPINNLVKGCNEGQYTSVNILDGEANLKKAKGRKRVFLVRFDHIMDATDLPHFLGKKGFNPCVDAPNYLLGLMSQVSEDELSRFVNFESILAFESGNPSFDSKVGVKCHLLVGREFKGQRRLYLAAAYSKWPSAWACLAELA